MKYFQHIFVIFAKVLPQHFLIQALDFNEVLGHSLGLAIEYDPLADILAYSLIWLLIECKYEQLHLPITFL